MFQNKFSRPFAITGLLALIPIGVFTLFSKSLKHSHFNAWELFQVTATYFAMFGVINLIMAFGYLMKTKDGREVSHIRHKRNWWFSVSAFVIFGLGALLGTSIGAQKFGIFVGLSLLANFVSLILFMVIMVKASHLPMDEEG